MVANVLLGFIAGVALYFATNARRPAPLPGPGYTDLDMRIALWDMDLRVREQESAILRAGDEAIRHMVRPGVDLVELDLAYLAAAEAKAVELGYDGPVIWAMRAYPPGQPFEGWPKIVNP